MNPWSRDGVALYPPKYPVVGQNRIFNIMHSFKQNFIDHEDLCGFLVLVGDWGLGKTRLGYELIAEAVGGVDEWLLDPKDYVVPNTQGRILKAGLSEEILPLFTDYKGTIDDDLAAETWVPKVAGHALSLLWHRPTDLRVQPDLLDDVKAMLNAKGVDLNQVKATFEAAGEWGEKLEGAMMVLRRHGIEYLWVVVDEVETPGDMRANPNYTPGIEVDMEDLMMISQVIKEARYRENHPYVNFLLLCSLGMSEVINIGPNRRRSDLEPLEPNHIADVDLFQQYLQESGATLDYPQGTLEGVFIATNRNFGWFNKVMSSIHTSWDRHKGSKQSLPPAWKLIEEYAMAQARSREVFNLSILKTIEGIPTEVQGRLVFGQLPIQVGPDLAPATVKKLLAAEIPGVGPAFASLVQIHINEATLSTELVKPEYGFKKTDEPNDEYANAYTQFSVSGVLSALRAFSVSVKEAGDFVIYEDLDQFAEQLATLYPRGLGDVQKSIERAAEPLHRIFKGYAVQDRRFLAASFKLLKKINVKMGVESRGVFFFDDHQLTEAIEKYAAEQAASPKKRMAAVCRGMAKVLDDTPILLRQLNNLPNVQHVAFESDFNSPIFEELAVTGSGRATVVYSEDVSQTAHELSTMLGSVREAVHPILVLFGPDGDIDGFEKECQRYLLLQRSIISRKLTTFEEEFLIKYSGRDNLFDPARVALSQHTLATREGLRQELRGRFQAWRKGLEQAGYVLRPIWYKPVSGKEDFYRGYRYMVAKNETVDGLDPALCQVSDWDDLSRDNFINGAKKNIDPGRGYTVDCLTILETEPFKPAISPTLVRVLQEIKAQAGEDNVAKRFFFAARDKEVRGKQISQIIDFLQGLGVVVSPVQGQFRAVNRAALDEQRTRVSSWLTTTANDLIDEIRDIFPDQAKALEKGFKAEAQKRLQQAEKITASVDFSFLDEEDPNVDTLGKLIANVYEFEGILLGICPPDPHQPFDLTEAYIETYQNKYQALSFWEKVQFLLWLRKKYAEVRNEVLREIGKQVVDVDDYAMIDGYRFPTVPLTNPLLSIQTELEIALAGQKTSLREFLELPDYPLSISNYLYQSNYSAAWARLNRLAELVSKTAPDSIWQRFTHQYERWGTAIAQFSQARSAWEDLNAFMSDAPATVWSGATGLRKEYEALQDQVDGGLEHDIQGYVSTYSGLALLDKLAEEIDASAPKFPNLATKVSNFHEDVQKGLKKIINDRNLQALNHLLRAQGEADWHAPAAQKTYQMTRDTCDTFNNQVTEKGRACLEGQGKQTNWELWVEIYTDLDEGTYTKQPDHEKYLAELEHMGLVKTTVVLT
jgi:hypothetical protein